MATNKHIIQIITKGAGKSKKDIQGISASLGKMAAKAAVAAAVFFAVKGLISGVTELARQAAKIEALTRGFDSLGKKINFNSQSFKKLDNAVNGTMKRVDLMAAANNAMMLGIVKSDDEMAQLFDTAQRLGQALGKDTAFSIDSMVTGMGRQSKLMLDNLGIMIDVEDAYEEYAETLNKTTANLTDAERKTAFNNAVLKESARLVSNLGDEVQDNQMAFQQMDVAFDELSIVIGELFAPAVNLGVRAVTSLAEAMADVILLSKKQEEFLSTEYIGTITETARTQFELIKSFEKMKKFELVQELMRLSPEFKKIGFVATEAALASGELSTTFDGLTETTVMFNEESARTIELNTINEVVFTKLVELYALASEGMTALQMTYSTFNVDMNAKVALQKQELEFMDKWIEANPKVAKGLNLITSSEARMRKGMKGMVSDLQVIASEFKDFEKVAKAAAIAQTIFDTYESAQRAFLNFQKSPLAIANPPLAFALGVAAAATATGAGLARVSQIKKAQYGADFVTDGPQMMIVGEGGGAEHVQVTPLVDENREGPQGQGITVNISGNVLHDSFVEDSVIPQIREGLRLGENMGI